MLYWYKVIFEQFLRLIVVRFYIYGLCGINGAGYGVLSETLE